MSTMMLILSGITLGLLLALVFNDTKPPLY